MILNCKSGKNIKKKAKKKIDFMRAGQLIINHSTKSIFFNANFVFREHYGLVQLGL